MAASKQAYILGLDLGVQSVGWAIIDVTAEGQPCGIRRAGVRCFDSGVGSESKISSGKDESQNIKRRQMRLQRRQLWRRGRRLKSVFRVLQRIGLLPSDETHTPEQRHQVLKSLDIELSRQFLPAGDRVAGHLLPYRLRKAALDQPLPPFALGRAIFHLAQRRGFLSNRKSDARNEEETGKVKAGIAELWQKMEIAKSRTLGEYFAGLDPEEDRIRQRWTARKMYLDEFEMIWNTQLPHHPNLTEDNKQKVFNAIFHQRPLKPQLGLIGMCELENTCRRAPRASIEAQRFRYLQKVNDLEICTPSGEIWRLNAPEHAGLRQKTIDLLESRTEIEFKSLRSKLGLKKPKGGDTDYSFNLEAGGEKKLKGNGTAVKLKKVLGDNYNKFPPDQLASIVQDLWEYENREALSVRLTRRYGIPKETADQLADIVLEPNYASLSREAIQKLLPLMEKGISFATAKKQVYGDYAGKLAVRDLLPPVLDAVPELRNPVVCRGLTEMRKVVNALIRQYGKPNLIRIELARDLKRSRQQREDFTKQNRENEKSRDTARKKIAAQLHCDPNAVSNLDILKVRLAEECNWECPYTGKSISIESLIGPHSQFDIEHIIPFSRSLDNSFINKTLCHHAENRSVKRNQTPFEAYSANETRWQEIIGRVKRFRGSSAYPKLRKFLQKELDGDFAARMLQDTRYMSRLATEYLGSLYGGVIDADGTRRVQVSAGRITAFLRSEWGLNVILADGNEDEKNRCDHRHHAVDAIIIALTDANAVKVLSRSAEVAAERGHRLFALDTIAKPWSTLLEDACMAIAAINVSYRVDRRVSGALHEETNYSKPHVISEGNGKRVEYRHFRKPLQNMSGNEVSGIVDPAIRRLVEVKLSQNGGDPKKIFADPANLPYLTSKDGRHIFIHKARIRKKISAVRLGKTQSPRFVAPGSNHHMEVFAVLDEHGRETSWEAKTVSLLDAAQRLHEGIAVVQRDHGPNTCFKFSLAGNEYLELDGDNGNRRLVRVVVISGKNVEFRVHNDARPSKMMREKGGRAGLAFPVNSLRKAKARKVTVDPLGNVVPAND
jgi:CRISPR-associated endonuclease Csn1